MEEWQRRMGGCWWEWGKRSRRMRVHGGFFVLATFDETTLILEPVGDAGERNRGQGNAREKGKEGRLTSDKSW